MRTTNSFKHFLPLFALLLLLAAGCTNDDINPGNEETTHTQGGDITFNIGFASQAGDSPQLRVATSRLFNSTWEDGDQIGLFAVRHNGSGGTLQSSGNYMHNVKLTYSSANGGSWNAETPLWFPGSDVLDFYAYYPYNASATNPKAIDFNVSADQSAETGGKSNYNLSDLLTAKSAGVAKTASPVALTFSHALAMVQVSIPSNGKGFGPGKDLKVMLRGVKTRAALNLADISATAGSEISIPSTGNDAASISMLRVEQPGDTDYQTSYTYRALVPAQSLPAGSSLFWFEHEGRQLLQDALASPLQMIAGRAETFTRSLPATLTHTVLITAGTFIMGSPTTESGRGSNEMQHQVTLTKDFYMGKYEVTTTQYAAFLNAKGIGSDGKGSVTYSDYLQGTVTASRIFIASMYDKVYWDGGKWVARAGYENHPVVKVTWYGAKAFTDWAGGSLPTEAQWEYACRAGTSTAFSYGDTPNGDYMWYSGNSPQITQPVGTRLPNLWGLYDMHGNVAEWCSDGYAAYSDTPVTDPIVPASYHHAARGGNMTDSPRYCRSAVRSFISIDEFPVYIGLRVVFVR